MKRVLRYAAILSISAFLGSCSTTYLGKYKKGSSSGNTTKSKVKTAAVVPIEGNKFRFHQPFANVWNGALDILLENYNLTIVDRRSGIITTEWDSFYIGDKVYRNKLSLRLKKISFNMVDVTIHNSVESWKAMNENGLQAAWMPAKVEQNEMVRIIQNMAVAMKLPKPVIPREMIAGSRRDTLQ